MSEFLTVRLSSQQDAEIPWLVWSSQQQEVIASGKISGWEQLSELATYAAQRTTIVLLAASDLVLTKVDIPSGASRQLESMLPYLIEDEIAQDVDDLHFSILQKTASTAYVAGVDRSYLTHCLEQLKSAGMEVKKVLPDVLAVPLHDGLSALQMGKEWLIRKEEYLGVSLEAEWLELFSHSEWVKQDDQYLPLNAYTPLPELTLAEGQHWQQAEPQLVMALLTEQAIASKITLLTGSFKAKSSFFKHWQVWQKSTLAACLLLVISTAYNVLQSGQYETQATAYRVESERVFRAVFPDKQKIPTVSYLKRQMNDEASRLAGGGSGGAMLEWLAKLPASIGSVPNMRLQSVKYDGNRGEIRLEAQSNDFQSFELARVQLEKQFMVEQGQLNRSGEIVNGTFVLKSK
ncbi:type II secretion system protein GspL [Vibrio aestuarianus]|uniref:Type II secretion system protein L n=1 Tax=Vibrio aestuarianus TaxID=28171 RepID=A0A9X4J0N3_9VIBR|nr:type II secretion system protein GspL [Vibrio aestuarianus]MDE1235575.1 type II secretion system protein GspL [Vibrio aestuarianus]MDE1246443.1 type II secretion system protein GspL [Vibrio aestuarianus]MDE1347161.1 type II secretion system protein GspL [Vibrio aestuarianus]NGZ63540.1 type II secretion system protein GspL [Vibrio aestuarianus subsp. cardii]